MKIWQLDPASMTVYYDLSVCSGLAQAGHEVTFITSKSLYDARIKLPTHVETRFHYFRWLEHQGLLKAPRLRKALRALSYPADHLRLMPIMRREQPALVHLQWSRVPVFDRWLVIQIKKMGIPVVHTIHDVEPLFSQGRFSGRLEEVYALVDAFVVHGPENYQRFLQHYPALRPDTVHQVPMVVDDDPYLPQHATQTLARQRLGIPLDRTVILSFGAIKHYKGLDILAQIMPDVLERHPEVMIWIVGKPERASDLKPFENFISHPQVHIHSDYVPSDEAWCYHLAADVMVFPYRQITQSAALLTALNYGIPAIATRIGGLPELVQDNGWLVPPEDPRALKQALLEAIARKPYLAAIGTAAAERIRKYHQPQAVASQLIGIYEALIRTSAPGLPSQRVSRSV
jgi:glycosyltransferase involved in cell wall biosynthesis